MELQETDQNLDNHDNQKPITNGLIKSDKSPKKDVNDENAQETSVLSNSSRGEAPVKSEYLLKDQARRILNTSFVSDEDKKRICQPSEDEHNEPKAKRLRGMNKNRRTLMNERNQDKSIVKLCSKFAGSFGLEELENSVEQCPFADQCKFSHDVAAYVASEPGYLMKPCYNYLTYGFCGYGARCKFAPDHLHPETHHNMLNKTIFYENGPKFDASYKNLITPQLKLDLRKKKYNFTPMNDLAGPPSLYEKEWTKVDFNGKLYLAPLTTVGNLPFRRICKEFGADITCGEMALAQNLLEGSVSEWALLRRHATEDIFGVQICGSNQEMLTKTCKLINDVCDVDFIDINMGCPIDLVYKKGAGSGLMGRSNKICQIITSMSRVSRVPITLKMRTGIYEGKPIADKLISSISSQFPDGRLGLITVHGRSREGRYTKSANWNYINECATNSCSAIPVFGSGDILSYEDYNRVLNTDETKISGAMIGRGALIKPWIFTEIKEQRHWDISSKERLEILQRFVNYGLEQWGSDFEGVEKTRKFLLEWLSFLYRYIPVGLLEVVPQKINDRPPLYTGRDELETLFASPRCEDWIKISEMLLGPVKENFFFLPKHKANAYA